MGNFFAISSAAVSHKSQKSQYSQFRPWSAHLTAYTRVHSRPVKKLHTAKFPNSSAKYHPTWECQVLKGKDSSLPKGKFIPAQKSSKTCMSYSGRQTEHVTLSSLPICWNNQHLLKSVFSHSNLCKVIWSLQMKTTAYKPTLCRPSKWWNKGSTEEIISWNHAILVECLHHL